MKTRTVSHLLYGEVVSMGGMPIRQPFPTQNVEQIDPFLLLHHHRTTAGEPFEGVGPHPHRGFSPVSFIFEGSLRHQDSRGNDSVISAGGIQWMNSGMGIIHSERPVDVEADLELIQLWINTPAAHKMDQPVYIPVTAEEAGLFKSDDGLVSAKIFAGEVLGTKGKVKALSPVNAATFDVKKGGKISIPHACRPQCLHLSVRWQLSSWRVMDWLKARMLLSLKKMAMVLHLRQPKTRASCS
jgi:redox-sensitive bicupin YhaK (pirin superfamily)